MQIFVISFLFSLIGDYLLRSFLDIHICSSILTTFRNTNFRTPRLFLYYFLVEETLGIQLNESDEKKIKKIEEPSEPPWIA